MGMSKRDFIEVELFAEPLEVKANEIAVVASGREVGFKDPKVDGVLKVEGVVYVFGSLRGNGEIRGDGEVILC